MIRDRQNPPLSRKQWVAAFIGLAAFASLFVAGFLWGPFAAGLGFIIFIILGLALAQREAKALHPPD